MQLLFLQRTYRNLTARELTRAFNNLFDEDRTEKQIKSTLSNHGFGSGRITGRFEKGHKPWNFKGSKGLVSANSGSFKKGDVPANTRPLDSTRICSKDGYILVKVAAANPYTGSMTRYRAKHVHIWEKANGPVPAGMVILFIDGEKLHCELKNLMLVSRTELLILNQTGYSDAPAELKPSILALAKLKAKAFSFKTPKKGARK